MPSVSASANQGQNDAPAGALPSPSRVSARRSATRAKLLAAAFDVFAEKGFGRSTVEDVCDVAGFSRGAFYSNFASLDELFFALYDQRSGQSVAALVAEVEGLGSDEVAPALLPSLVDRMLTLLGADRRWYLINAEFTAHAVRHPEVAAQLTIQRRAMRRALGPVVSAGAAARGDSLSPLLLDELTRAVVALHDGIWAQMVLEPHESGLTDLRRELIALVLSGYPRVR